MFITYVMWNKPKKKKNPYWSLIQNTWFSIMMMIICEYDELSPHNQIKRFMTCCVCVCVYRKASIERYKSLNIKHSDDLNFYNPHMIMLVSFQFQIFFSIQIKNSKREREIFFGFKEKILIQASCCVCVDCPFTLLSTNKHYQDRNIKNACHTCTISAFYFVCHVMKKISSWSRRWWWSKSKSKNQQYWWWLFILVCVWQDRKHHHFWIT